MRKSRWIAIAATVVVLAGLGMGVVAYLYAPGTSAQASVLPEAAAWMPASANFVAYLDLASLASSPLREEWESSTHRQEAMDEVEEFREKTGINPWTDFQSLSISGREMEKGKKAWGVALNGELDPERLIAAVEEHETIERESHGDTTLYTFSKSKGTSHDLQALAFPSSTTALFGSPDYVRTMLDVGQGQEASAVDGVLKGWLNELPLDETFWCVGSAKAGLNRLMVGRKGEATHLPPLDSFAISGNLDQDVSMIARGRAADPESARKLADVVRGFVALGSLQQQQRPEIQTMLDSIHINIVDNTVVVSLAVPYETIRRLSQPTKEAVQ